MLRSPARDAELRKAAFPSVADGTPDLSDDLARARDHARVLALTTRIVAAHLANASNRVGCGELPGLIQAVHASLATVGAVTSAAGTVGPHGLVPAVPPARSVFPDYIICLENGRRFRSMRRHLMAAFGLTPEQYRRRWGLPHDYPMIAPSYARNRSGVAKATGLGRRKPGARSGDSHRPG
jgi:predicted transcriptional regulator